MTTNRRAKKEARSRMERTGEPYSVARRATLNPDTTRFPEGLAFLDDHCANCLEPLPEGEDGLFCSSWCQEAAKHVRYFRRVFRDGRIQDPDVQEAVRVRLAFLPAGGYEALGRNLSPQTRDAVKQRANGLCQKCGAPGADIDHIAGSSADPDNLQLLCKQCHTSKTAESLVLASPEIRVLIDQLMFDRVMPETPRLLADDPSAWESTWRRLKFARRERLLDELADLDVEIWEPAGRAEMIAIRDDAIAEPYGEESEWDGVDEDGGVAFAPEAADNFDGGYGPNSYLHRAMNRDD